MRSPKDTTRAAGRGRATRAMPRRPQETSSLTPHDTEPHNNSDREVRAQWGADAVPPSAADPASMIRARGQEESSVTTPSRDDEGSGFLRHHDDDGFLDAMQLLISSNRVKTPDDLVRYAEQA